ncbi:MAG: glycosyltransferase family 1 protein [Candidatus Alcyoniella australis]|nr:glycosyltransferase family 1 protein [Candidatus Alcyoniella australis]
MRIGLNSEKVLERTTGVGCYAYNLVRGLLEIDRDNRYVLFFHSDAGCYAGEPWLAGPNVELDQYGAKGSNPRRILWEQLGLPGRARRSKLDVFHYIDHTLSMIGKPVPTAITVHDLAFFRHPEAYTRSRRIYKSLVSPRSIRRADRVIAVSEYTRQEVLEITGADPDKVSVVYNGIDGEFRVIQDQKLLSDFRRQHDLPQRYILFVGTLQPRKNVTGLVRAYAELVQRKAVEHDLVICGERGWIFDEIFSQVERSGLTARVRFIESLPQQQLPLLYNCAELFVFPSLFEGFGLPLLEAMSCGVPVVSSNTTSMPEVVGDAALLVDPNDVDDMALQIQRALSDRELAADLRNRGLERSREFSWRKCAQSTLEIYKQMAQS